MRTTFHWETLRPWLAIVPGNLWRRMPGRVGSRRKSMWIECTRSCTAASPHGLVRRYPARYFSNNGQRVQIGGPTCELHCEWNLIPVGERLTSGPTASPSTEFLHRAFGNTRCDTMRRAMSCLIQSGSPPTGACSMQASSRIIWQ